MSKTLDVLDASLNEIPSCQVSSIVSRKTGLTLFRSGELEDVDVEKLNRDLAKLFSSSLLNPYGDAWNLPDVKGLHLRFATDKLLFAVPIDEDNFWSFVVFDSYAKRRQRDIIAEYLPKIKNEFEEARK